MQGKDKYHLLTWALDQVQKGDDDGYLSEPLNELLLRAQLACDEENKNALMGPDAIREIINNLAPGGSYMGMKKMELIRLLNGTK